MPRERYNTARERYNTARERYNTARERYNTARERHNIERESRARLALAVPASGLPRIAIVERGLFLRVHD